jgi:tetratricopeptide (TPR) repeat protein
MDTFGPENFATLQRCVRDELPAPSLKTALATIRLAAWDADVFYKFKQVLIDKAPACGERQAADLWADALQVAERYFPLQASKDVAFELGRVAMGVKRHADAIRLFNASALACGDHHVTRYNIGICHWYRGEWLAAQAAFDASIDMRPDYADAAAWRTKVAAKLQGEAFIGAHVAGGAAVA